MKTEQASITDSYGHDHDRLDQLIATYQKLKRTDFARAKPNFREFKNGLYRHIQWEEDILFPLFEEKTGLRGSGPTEVMRIEHRQIIQLLEALHDKVRQHDPDSDREEQELLQVLGAHNQKEENILYPAIDQHINEGERHEVFERMEEVPVITACGCGCKHHEVVE
ncbi:MAG: hemerythrin domain-containing protein [Verrucomicrobiae bacterium]|nr:hemerythrin domain-containing protein [Verrucomicrobiae bacterium]